MILKNMFGKKKTVGCFWLSLGSLQITEFAIEAEVDAIVFDLQHGLWDRLSLEMAAGLFGTGRSAPLARVQECSRYAISAALDAGMEGVLVPLVDTAGQARNAVDWSKYPPTGSRSGGGIRPLKDFPAYRQACAENTFVAVMVETATAVENVEEIVAVEGIDMIFIGTGDLALSLGLAPGDPEFEAALEKVRNCCVAVGVSCGIFTPDPEEAARRGKQGYAMVVIGDDITKTRKMIKDCRSGFEGCD